MKRLFKAFIPASLKTILKKPNISVEPESVIERRRVFYSQFAGENDLVFDIGANYGNRVEPLIRNQCKVIAIEPQPDCVKYLKWKYGKRIVVEDIGIGSVRGKLDLHISNWSILSTFSDDFINKTRESGRFTNNTYDKTIKIDIITLDDLITKYGVPKFIKADVEGFEVEVFRGLTKKVNYISFEYTLPELSDNLLKILDRLNTLGVIEINFSTDESMELNLKTWMGYQSFLNAYKNDKVFLASMKGFGDIYLKFL